MYQPDPFNDNTELGQYLTKELSKISDHTQTNEIESLSLKVWNAAPDKPRAGQIYYADGTNWNPGSGEGIYHYTSGSVWSKL